MLRENIRLEYLYPNIDDKRMYDWLNDSEFDYYIVDSDIVKLSFDELIEKTDYLSKIIVRTGFYDKDITEQCKREFYDNWCNLPYSNIGKLDYSFIEFDNKLTYELSVYLASHPLKLPAFIQEQAIDIIGLFLGIPSLNLDICMAEKFETKSFWMDQDFSEKEYRRYNNMAKYRLSLFISVLNNLLDLGVNLSEYKFSDIQKNISYSKINVLEKWNEKLIKITEEKGYIRCDGQRISRDKIIDLTNFTNLNEFFECILKIVQMEYQKSLIRDSKIPNPFEIRPVRPTIDVGNIDISTFKEEQLVDVGKICTDMQRKIAKIAKNVELRILNRKLKDLKECIIDSTVDDTKKYDIVVLYKEIKGLDKKNRDIFLNRLNKLLQNKNLGVNIDLDYLENEVDKTSSESLKDDKEEHVVQNSTSSLEENVEKNDKLEALSKFNPNTLIGKIFKKKILFELEIEAVRSVIAANEEKKKVKKI